MNVKKLILPLIDTEASITVHTSFRGFHRWPKAPDEVSFLRSLHRHFFGVQVELAVNHTDRQYEFFTVQRLTDSFVCNCLAPALLKNESMSCENMATYLFQCFCTNDYPVIMVRVDEDGENFATVKRKGGINASQSN